MRIFQLAPCTNCKGDVWRGGTLRQPPALSEFICFFCGAVDMVKLTKSEYLSLKEGV